MVSVLITGDNGYELPGFHSTGTGRETWRAPAPRAENGSGSTRDAKYPDGNYTVTFIASDRAGNESAEQTWKFTVDTTPRIEAPGEGQQMTNTAPTISGYGEKDARITVFEGDTEICTTTVIESAWSCEASGLAVGTHTITAHQYDAGGDPAGPAARLSVPVMFEIIATDRIAPVAITAPSNGASVAARPVISGTGEPGARVSVQRAGAEVGTAIVAADGTWVFPFGADLGHGEYTFTVIQDVDGSLATVSFVVPSPVNGSEGEESDTHRDGGLSLASTGADAGPPLMVGAGVLIVAGFMLMVARRRVIS